MNRDTFKDGDPGCEIIFGNLGIGGENGKSLLKQCGRWDRSADKKTAPFPEPYQPSEFTGHSIPCSASQRSASIDAMQPEPAAEIAWRYVWSWTSPQANTPSMLVFMDFPCVTR